jgi:hypothetical protein
MYLVDFRQPSGFGLIARSRKQRFSCCPSQYASEKSIVKHYYWLYMIVSLITNDSLTHYVPQILAVKKEE